MHFRTHVKDEHRGLSGQGEYDDGMVEHDLHVGMILDKLDELGHRRRHHRDVLDRQRAALQLVARRRHHAVPLREEQQLGGRVPRTVLRPLARHWQAGVTLNGIVAHQDMLTTFLSAAGEPDIVEKCRVGHEAAGKTFKVVLDGKDMNDYFAGETGRSPRTEFFYVNDDAELVALRVGDWKFVFKEQRAKTLALWAEPFVDLRIPRIFNLRRDPFERALENSNTYWDWMIDHAYMVVPGSGGRRPGSAGPRRVPTASEARFVQLGSHPRQADGVTGLGMIHATTTGEDAWLRP